MEPVAEIASWLCVFAPGVGNCWMGRRLLRHQGDPVLAELQFSKSQRIGLLFGGGIALALVSSSALWGLKILMAVIATMAADFPARRKVFSESWGLLQYLSHALRFWSAMIGVWVLLALLPALLDQSGERALPVAIGLGIFILAWSTFSAQIFSRLVKARILSDAELLQVFEKILHRARCRRPLILEAGPEGGHWINAFALPSIHQPRVVLAKDLLKALTHAEAGAIFAHEVAHLEHFNRGRMVKSLLSLGVLLPLLIAGILFLRSFSMLGPVLWLWPLLCMVLLLAFFGRNQAKEKQSDLRALELGAEPEALISALTKTHQLMFLPRRWPKESGSTQSHPSLARRLSAIRQAAESQGGEEKSVWFGASTFRGADDPSRGVVMTADRILFLEGVDPEAKLDPSIAWQQARDCRAIRYDELVDLRLQLGRSNRRYLTAVDGRGQELKMTLEPQDVAAVKANLALIEGRLKAVVDVSENSRPGVLQAWGTRLEGFLLMLLGTLSYFSGSVVLAALLVMIRPARATLAAAGAVAVCGVLTSRWQSGVPPWSWEVTLVLSVLQLALGLFFIARTIRLYRQQTAEPEWAWKLTAGLLGGLSLLLLLGGISLLTSSLPFMQFHLWIRRHPGTILLLVGAAASLWASRKGKLRVPALAMASMAVLLALSGSVWVRNLLSSDSLVVAAGASPLTGLSLEETRTRLLDWPVSVLRLSPSGRRLAAAGASDVLDPRVERGTFTFTVELNEEDLYQTEAADLAFLDDDRVLLLVNQSNHLKLRLVELSLEPESRLEIELPLLPNPRLGVDPQSESWEVRSIDLESGTTHLVAGKLTSTKFDHTTRSFREEGDLYLENFSINSGSEALAIAGRWDLGYPSPAAWVSLLSGYSYVRELVAVGESGQRRVARTVSHVWCVDSLPGGTEHICVSTDEESTTHVWSFEADRPHLSLVASLPGPYYEGQMTSNERLLLAGYSVAPVILDLSTGFAATIRIADDAPLSDETGGELRWLRFFELQSNPWWFRRAFTIQGRSLALAFQEGRQTRVSILRLAAPDDYAAK